MYVVRKNMTPISAKNTNVIEMLAALKRRLRNTLTSSIGCVACAAPRRRTPR